MPQEMGTFCQKLVPLSTPLAKKCFWTYDDIDVYFKLQFFATNGIDGIDQDFQNTIQVCRVIKKGQK